MAKQETKSRISHHTTTTGNPFTVPSQEDFTTGSWTNDDLALSEIGVDELNNEVYIRTGSTITNLTTWISGSGNGSIITKSNSDSGGSATGQNSVAEGGFTTAAGDRSHAEGTLTVAFGQDSHTEGSGTTANGAAAHAEGINTLASGDYSHAEGNDTNATGNHSHSEGISTSAIGHNSHAGGAGAVSTKNGEWSRSTLSGGEAQYGIIDLYTTTSGAVSNDLSISGGSSHFDIEPNTAYRINLTTIVKNTSTYDTKEWSGSCLIKNVGGTTTLVGTATMTSVNGDVSLATATLVVTANDTVDRLAVTATGIAAMNLSWYCKCEYIRIG